MLLDIRDLCVSFYDPVDRGRTVRAVECVGLSAEEGSFTSLVGESGSGKSVTALSVCRLIRPPVLTGSVIFSSRNGRLLDLLALRERDLLGIRGGEIAYIFQDPGSSLNPVMRVGAQMTEALRLHVSSTAGEAFRQCREALAAVRIRDADRVYRSFPHELSGGMKQRVMIAMALVMKPRLLIADEPTTALDVTTEGEILSLLKDLQRSRRLAILFITHNLALASKASDAIYVLQKGSVVETLRGGQDPAAAREAYTRRLFNAQLVKVRPKTEVPL